MEGASGVDKESNFQIPPFICIHHVLVTLFHDLHISPEKTPGDLTKAILHLLPNNRKGSEV